MIIGIDGNEANVVNRSTGVHQYSFQILWSFYRINKTTSSSNSFIIYLSKPPLSDLPKENTNWKYVVIPGNRMWLLTKLTPRLIFSREVDVFFSPSHYLPLLTRIPMICTIHDLGYLVFTEQFRRYDFWQLKYWTAISIIISKYIIAVSKSTSSDIVRHYKFASKKISVVPHGYNKDIFNNQISSELVRRVLKKFDIGKNYILFLSLLKPSKNLEGVIEAFNKICKKHKDIKLVVAGRKGWLYESIYKRVIDLNLEDKIIFTDYVDELDKPLLLKGAKMLVSPSFWEGFGMHVLEALACGTPVIISKEGSLPEVAGDVGFYVDPKETTQISSAIERILDMSGKSYNKLSDKCRLQASKFSWEKSGKQTLDVLTSLI